MSDYNEYYHVNIERYGITPPGRSRNIWQNINESEDEIINSLDYQLSLQKLPPIEKEIIIYINQGYTEREIAEIKKMSQPRINDIKKKAFMHLKILLST